MIIELSWFEFLGCVEVGMLRFAASNLANLNHASTYDRTWLERLADEVIGACGERAYCKARGQYWDGSVNTFHREPDATGRVEIRTTPLASGCLILRDNDPEDRWYVLVTAAPPVMTVHGYIRGDRREPQWQRNPHGHRRAWFVPQAALTPLGGAA